jgi:hypothetical protein
MVSMGDNCSDYWSKQDGTLASHLFVEIVNAFLRKHELKLHES